MRNFLLSLALLLALVPAAKAQTRVLVGPSGGYSYDNGSLGVAGSIEQGFGKHFETDFSYRYSPLESHVALGHGHANLVYGRTFIWFGKFGLTGRIESSGYVVTKISKRSDYIFGGVAYRTKLAGAPVRWTLNYVQQFENGISNTGLETPHLKGVSFAFDVRLFCAGAVCFRESADFQFGHVLTQGNPYCDGTYSGCPNVIPRTGAFGGGTQASFMMEFPRHRGQESDVF